MNRFQRINLWRYRKISVAVIVAIAFSAQKQTVIEVSAAELHLASADEGRMPDLGGAVGWLNTPPLSAKALRGKVVLIDVWTYSCINSLRQLPYMKMWAEKYKDAGLVVIGVHSPEFGFEKDRANVEKAVRDFKVTYPVAIDSDQRIWQALNNEYWPADYIIDAKGRIRYHHFGEGDYDKSERIIQQLLKENGATGLDGSIANIAAQGIEAPPGEDQRSPETYLGYRRTENFASSPRIAADSRKTYALTASPTLNRWGLGGSWNVGTESSVLQAAPGKVMFRFHSRDLHMVLGPAKDGKPIRFKVTLDGTAPGEDHGLDSSPDGTGEVREPRLYQLIRQKGPTKDRTFEIEFLDPGVQAFSFTFG